MGLEIEVLRIQENELKVGGKEFYRCREQGVWKVRWAGKQGEAGLLAAAWWGEEEAQEECWPLPGRLERNLTTISVEVTKS